MGCRIWESEHPNQLGKLSYCAGTWDLRNEARLWYKQHTESSVWLAGRFLSQLSSLVRHLYVQGRCALIIPATGWDSEAVRPLKGTFKARTSKASSLLNFLSSALARPEGPARSGRPYCCALFSSVRGAPQSSFLAAKAARNDNLGNGLIGTTKVVPFPVWNLSSFARPDSPSPRHAKTGRVGDPDRGRLSLHGPAKLPCAADSHCGKQVEIHQGRAVDRAFRGTVCLKGFEDGGLLVCRASLDRTAHHPATPKPGASGTPIEGGCPYTRSDRTEFAPLRRNADSVFDN
jgi:hypothetical protein